MICLQVVYLLLEELGPEVLTYELDGFKMIIEPWPLLGVSFRELVADLITNGFDPTSSDLRLVGVEAIAIRRHNLCYLSIHLILIKKFTMLEKKSDLKSVEGIN